MIALIIIVITIILVVPTEKAYYKNSKPTRTIWSVKEWKKQFKNKK